MVAETLTIRLELEFVGRPPRGEGHDKEVLVPTATVTLARPVGRLDDDELLSLVRLGDERAFAELHRRFRGALLASARRLLRGTSIDPEDAVQDTFIRAHRFLTNEPDRPIAIGPWLHVVLRNRCLDLLRQPHGHATGLQEEMPAGSADPAGVMIEREQLRLLVAAIARLPARQREALAARALMGASHEDLASRLQTTPSAVKSLLGRARTRLALTAAA